ncbi:hypothetical protein GCM10020331_039770 [Ectobacillus funiculus]
MKHFYDETELLHALRILRKETNVPIIAQLALHEVGLTQSGTYAETILAELLEQGADVVGLNCRLGPLHMIESLQLMSIPEKKDIYLHIQMQACRNMQMVVTLTREL